ncbi:MAG TPA: tetratricopeptide repeat protein, partial [Candidatus Acidoferrum sp.]
MISSHSILCVATLLLAGTHAAAVVPQDPPPKSTQSQSQAKPQKVRNPLNDLLDEAQAAIDKNDYEAAIPALQKFIAEKPDVAYAHFQLAYAYTALKRPDEARAEYARCVALDPKMAEAQLNLGILLLESQPAAAIPPLRKAVELLPSQSRPRYLLGLAYESTGDLTAAGDAFEGATRLDPKDADALTHLGIILYRNKRPVEAEAKFRDVLQVQPQSPAALQGLAQCLDVQKKPDAAGAYRKYLAVQPNDAAARARLIHVLIEQQQFDAALVESEQSNAGHLPNPETLKLRADIQIGQKKVDDAIVTLQQAIAIAPQDAQLHGGLGRLYLQKRAFPEAERELKIALQFDRNNLTY